MRCNRGLSSGPKEGESSLDVDLSNRQERTPADPQTAHALRRPRNLAKRIRRSGAAFLAHIPARYLSHVSVLLLVVSMVIVGGFRSADMTFADVPRSDPGTASQAAVLGGASETGNIIAQQQPQIAYQVQRPRDGVVTYIVKQGDTVSSVAERYMVDEDTIRQANNLSNGTLTPGKQLIVLPVSGLYVTVRPGDTPGSLARMYDSDSRAILQYNTIVDPNNLAPGAKLVIPGGRQMQAQIKPTVKTTSATTQGQVQGANPAPQPAPAQTTASAPAAPANNAPAAAPAPKKYELRVYKVQPGDTLASIAEQFGLSLQTMLDSNNLSEDSLLHPGQELWILPVNGLLHTVAPGDTLRDIAAHYNADMSKIIEVNNLGNASLIKPGDWLVIPDGQRPVVQELHEQAQAYTVVNYEVRPGDTVRDIAEHFGVSSGTIVVANGLSDASLIKPGQQLQIPGGDPNASMTWETSQEATSVAPKVQEAQQPAPAPAPKQAAAPSQPSAPAPKAAASSDLGMQIANVALRYSGYPYVFGGTTPGGFDCSGFTSYVYSRFGIYIGRDTWAQWRSGTPVSQRNLLPGDLVFFNTYASVSHVGIYIGGGMMINAQSESVGVAVTSIYGSYWGPRYVGARRPW